MLNLSMRGTIDFSVNILKNKVVFFVVSYDKEISEIETLDLLTDFADCSSKVNVVLWNNGPYELKVDDDKLIVLNHLNNSPLAFVYNNLVNDFYSYDYYVILDDDSTLTSEYLNAIMSLDNLEDPFLGVPIVKSQGVQISPFINYSRTRFLMSGLVVNRSVFENYGKRLFDERFQFYGVDWALSEFVHRNRIPIKLLPSITHKKSSHITENSLFRRREISRSLVTKIFAYPCVNTFLEVSRAILKDLILFEQRLDFQFLIKKVFRRHYD